MHLSPLARARIRIARALTQLPLRSSLLRAFFTGARTRPVEGLVVDPDIAVMIGLDAMMNSSDLRRRSAPIARAQQAEAISMVEIPKLEGVTLDTITLRGDAGPIPARRYVPEGLAAPSPAVLFIHGGGWVTGDLDTHDTFCRQIAVEGRLRVIAVDYRLAPEHPFPAAVDDSLAAFRDVAARADELGVDPAQIAVMGDSAGGNLSAVVSLRTRGDARRPALQVLVYPAVDATFSHRSHAIFAEGWVLTKGMIDWYYDHYAGDAPSRRRDPDISPLHAEDHAGLPPALIYTAGFDPLRDEAAAYAERLTAAGVSNALVCFDSMVHGFVLMGGFAEGARDASSRIIRETAKALRDGLG